MYNNVYKFSEEFQLKILALLVRQPEMYLSFKEIIKPQYFKKSVHIDFANMILDFYKEEEKRSKQNKEKINPPTVDVLLEQVRKFLISNSVKRNLLSEYIDIANTLCEVDLSDRGYIKDSIVDFAKRSAMEQAILKSAEELQKKGESADYDRILSDIKKANAIGEELDSLGTMFFEEASERMETYEKGTDGVRRVPTGLEGIDKVTRGGLGNGELGVIIAPPNRGKSFALINIGAGAVENGYNVVHYTLEMPESQVSLRYDSKFTKKSFEFIKSNTAKVLQSLKVRQKTLKENGELVIKKYRTSEASVDTFRSHLTRLKMERGFVPDLIVVDYGDLVKPTTRYKDKRFELEEVYLGLRDLGDEFGCPVWTASQGNRNSLDKKVITMADLAEAFNKANIADLMVALCQTAEEKVSSGMRWHIAKHRSGVASITLDGEIDYETANMLCYEVQA